MTEAQFDKQQFFEKTQYAGVKYGTKKEDIQTILDNGNFAVMPLDMCGAIAMKRHFPTEIIYVHKNKETLISSIIEEDFSVEEKTLRILSIDAEKRNRHICDMEIENQKDLGAEIILEKISLLNN